MIGLLARQLETRRAVNTMSIETTKKYGKHYYPGEFVDKLMNALLPRHVVRTTECPHEPRFVVEIGRERTEISGWECFGTGDTLEEAQRYALGEYYGRTI